MSNPLISKLECGADLTDEDRSTLERVIRHPRKVKARENLIREGQVPTNVHLVLDGFACRYKILPDGRRQIMAFLIPGDFCDLHVAVLDTMDHGIATLTPCTMVGIPRETIEELTTRHPRISRALWWCTLVDEAILREWLVNMGQRPAERQMAHILCELLVRLQTVGRATADSFHFPLTQEEFGDVLGLSIVHTNRSIQHLRRKGLIILKDGMISMPDVERLKEFADFNPNYLHLVRPPPVQPDVVDHAGDDERRRRLDQRASRIVTYDGGEAAAAASGDASRAMSGKASTAASLAASMSSNSSPRRLRAKDS